MILEMGFEELRAGDVLSIHWLCQPLVNTVPVPGFHKNKLLDYVHEYSVIFLRQ